MTDHVRRALERAVLFSIPALAWLAASAGTGSPPAPDLRVLDPEGRLARITTQLQNQSVIGGQSATFMVTATGDEPLSYQWTFNGLNVGSSSNAYTRSSCQLSDNGGRARVTVSNGRGSVQSSPAILTVNPPGTNYYVATNGFSGNTGLSSDSPWPLAYAVTKLGPGITLTLMPGLYTGLVPIYYVSGTASNPATVRSQYKWQALIANPAARGIEVWESQYIVLDGICVSNCAGSGIKVMQSNNTVRNCWITHNGNIEDQQGIDLSSCFATNNLCECNLIEFNGSGAGFGQGLYVSGQNHIVRGNVVRYNGGFGIHLYTEVAGAPVNNNCVYNNLTYGNTNRYGVTIWGADGNGNSPGTNYLFNNTILDGVSLNYGAVQIANNIILPSPINASAPIVLYSSPPVIWSDYNLGTKAITPAGAHDVIVNDAGFVNPGHGLYWLKSDSPARGSALPATCGPVDFFGRAQSSVLDIGAFQYNGALTGDTRILDPSPANPDYWSLAVALTGAD